MKKCLPAIRLVFTVFVSSLFSAHGQNTVFNYQGQLNENGAPANGTNYGMVFYIYDAATNGTALGNLGFPYVTVSNGVFAAALDFGNVFDGSARWLEVDVQKDGGPFTALWPRQPITSIPYAIRSLNAATASSVASSNLTGAISLGQLPNTIVTNGSTNINLSGSFSGNGAGVTNVNATAFNGLNSSNVWQSGGNNVAAGQFLGSTNNQAVEIWANGTRGLRVEPGIGLHGVSPNVIGGAPQNFVGPNTQGATIAGGGAVNFYGSPNTNSVTADFGTVSGGFNNTATANQASVAGGHQNIAAGDSASVGGGYLNNASGAVSAVPGGQYNVAAGLASIAAGGQSNSANATLSFAAGNRAKAINAGTFVWADSQNTDFSSSGINQFDVRAGGGAHFVTAGAGLTLDGQPVLTNNQTSVTLNGTFSGNGASLVSLNAGNVSSGTLSDLRLSVNVPLLNASQTFSGRDSFNQGIGIATTSALDGNLNINTNTYLFSHSIFLRGETGQDHNHGLAYTGNTVTNFGSGQYQVDGPALFGYSGGLLGTRATGDHAALQWNTSGATVNGNATITGTATINGNAAISGNLSANNTPGVSWNQSGGEDISFGSTEVNLGSEGNYKPATGVFVITAYASGDFNGNQVTLSLYDVSSSPVYLTSAYQQAPADGVYDSWNSVSLSWVVPITSAGGYQNFAITVRTDSGTSYIFRHNLTVMYFPRQNS